MDAAAIVVSLYSGYAAEEVLFPACDRTELKKLCKDDDAAAQQFLPLAKSGESQLRDRAKKGVEEHWQSIERLAECLVHFGLIFCEMADRIVEDPEFAFAMRTDPNAVQEWLSAREPGRRSPGPGTEEEEAAWIAKRLEHEEELRDREGTP